MKYLISLVFAVVFSTTAFADKVNCEKPVVAIEEAACASEFEETQTELAAMYAKLLESLPPEHKPFYEKEQQAWINCKDMHCDLEQQIMPNTMGSSAEITCIATANRERIEFLNQEIERRN